VDRTALEEMAEEAGSIQTPWPVTLPRFAWRPLKDPKMGWAMLPCATPLSFGRARCSALGKRVPRAAPRLSLDAFVPSDPPAENLKVKLASFIQ
jgi:hypothetical protein